VPRDWLDPAITRSWLDTLHWGQDEAKAAIERAAQKQPWKLEMSRLLAFAPGLTWQAIGASGFWETLPTDDYLKSGWLLAIKEILHFNQGWRIRRCAEPNCNAVLVGRTTSRYCDRHSTSAEKSRRFRERNAKTLTPEQKKKRRRRYYENYLRKHKGEAVTAAARRQRTKPTGQQRGR